MRRTTPRGALLTLALLVGLSACSAEASTRAGGSDGGPSTTAAPVSVPETIPEGTTLRVGDQFDYLQTLLDLSGEGQDIPYEVEYSAFLGGPAMLQAFQADAVDTGFVGSTPLIFAQAGGQDIRGVAGWASSESSFYGLVTAPGHDEIQGWEDLKGKSVAYQRGTAGEAVLLQALDAAGLSASDITPVDVSQVQLTATLEGGSADAGISVEPLTSGYLAANPTAAQVAGAEEITDRSSFVIASQDTLDDDAKSAALADYIARLVRGFTYLRDHPDELASGVFQQVYGLSAERAAELVEENGDTAFFALPGEVLDQQQRLADLFVEAGQIPAEIDVAEQFDTRFNELVLEEQGQ